MSNWTERFTEVCYPLAYDYSDSFAIGTHDSSYVSLANYHRAVLVLNVGDIQAGGTGACSIRQATSTAGAGATTITGKSITQLTQAGGDSDDLVCIELRTEELNRTSGYDCVSVRVVVAGAAAELSYILFGTVPRFPPTGTTNWTEVVD